MDSQTTQICFMAMPPVAEMAHHAEGYVGHRTWSGVAEATNIMVAGSWATPPALNSRAETTSLSLKHLRTRTAEGSTVSGERAERLFSIQGII